MEVKNSVSLNDVIDAARVIKPFIHRTPTVTSSFFDGITGKHVFFKCENFQKTGAFKIRGTTYAVQNIVKNFKTGRKPVIVTHSSGNHAQAVALASNINNVRAVVVMPETAPQVKKDAVMGYGAEIVESDPSQEGREATAKKLIQEIGDDAVFLSSSNDLRIIAGQGTIALEMLEDVPDLDAFLVPVSGGGMLSGVSIAAKGINPHIKVFAAEPINADDCAKSFAAKKRIPNKMPPHTIADGLKMNIGDLTWPIIRDNITDVITVTEEEIVAAMKLVFERMKLVIEPSAAVGVAAMLNESFKEHYLPNVSKIGIILCGGNTDLQSLPWVKAIKKERRNKKEDLPNCMKS